MDEGYDVVIVGSGPAGGRVALNLVKAGARCLLLEAGEEYTAFPDRSEPGRTGAAKAFPASERDYSTQMFWGGGIELSSDARMAFLRARCLGGTSIVNQALMDRFDAVALDDWKARTGLKWMSEEGLAADYDAVEGDLNIEEIRVEYHNRNTQIFTEAFDRHGYGWKVLRRAQGDCKLDQGSDCIVCLGGCRRESKQSSLVTTLRRAREQGLEVWTGAEVATVAETSGGARITGTRDGRDLNLEARAVVLAAGSLGTASILIRSGFGDRLPALGRGFACHPQVMTYATFDEEIDAHKGAFQAVKSDDPKLRKKGMKFENVFAPPIGTSMLMPTRGRELQQAMRKYRRMASMEVAIRDEATGTIALDRKGKLAINKKATSADQRKIDEGLAIVRELFESAGAREIIPCTDTFGLHLMGGCALGTDEQTSVVGPDFAVHGTSRVFATDSSLFPSAPGINPSLTVMALAQRASKPIQEAVA